MSTGGEPNANTIGKYQLVNCLASGNSCQVWEVVDSETTRRMAMKLVLPEKLKDAETISSLKHEFNAACNFDHPNIIKYHELFVKKQQAYFVMDLFPAPNLKAQLYNDIRSVQIRAKRLIENVAMALEYVHAQGWVHRDIKPENILMNRSAETRLIDFSLSIKSAGALGKLFHRKQSIVQGTRTYMAPEQILGKALTHLADTYSFGVTIFEILTGEAPYKGSTPKDLLLRHLSEPCPAAFEFNPNVTPEMSMVVQRMLAKKPEQRHQSMSEFLAEFRKVQMFKEEVTEKVEMSDKEKAEQELQASLGERLDSRTDHLRSQFGIAAPVKKKKAPVVLPTSGGKPAAAGQGGPAPAARPPAPQPPMPVAGMPQPPMGMPGMMPPQIPQPYAGAPVPYMMPGQGPWANAMPGGQPPMMPPGPWGQPGAPLPPQAGGYPMPPQVPGGYPTPPQVPMPGGLPPAPVAPRPVPPQAAVPGAPAAPARPAPAQPVPPAAKKPVPPKPKTPPKPSEGFNIGDLAGFDDLPPVN
ncbi:MAG: serine/threonine protein kinase [Planctomycetes bacterium]|nr:serine/threonine protein kinase [Planctomycetota bacterium]